jgi:hypothetical protein
MFQPCLRRALRCERLRARLLAVDPTLTSPVTVAGLPNHENMRPLFFMHFPRLTVVPAFNGNDDLQLVPCF